MLNIIVSFIKYNNATVLILLAIFILSAGVMAASPEKTGNIIGHKTNRIEGIDTSRLCSADLSENGLAMDFTIKQIQEDEKYYYVDYTFIDLDIVNNVWQNVLKEKTRKVSKK